ncbi:hypothetical protein D3C78_1051780 [compost metagenome]
MGTPRQDRNGTVSEPPPMPKIAEAQPTTPPATPSPALPGSPLVAFGCRPRDICSDTRMAKVPMIFCRIGPWIFAAVSAPRALPARMPRVIQMNTGQRTAPRRWCSRMELTEVKTMVASEVPTAICVSTSGEKPWAVKLYTSTGTMIRPPPTPNSPASTPAQAPSTR